MNDYGYESCFSRGVFKSRLLFWHHHQSSNARLPKKNLERENRGPEFVNVKSRVRVVVGRGQSTTNMLFYGRKRFLADIRRVDFLNSLYSSYMPLLVGRFRQ